MTTFTQLNARLKNFLRGWLLVLGLKEYLVECATLCIKSEVILLVVIEPLKTTKYYPMRRTNKDYVNVSIYSLYNSYASIVRPKSHTWVNFCIKSNFLFLSPTLASGIDVGPTFINFGFFSKPYSLIREYIKVI